MACPVPMSLPPAQKDYLTAAANALPAIQKGLQNSGTFHRLLMTPSKPDAVNAEAT